MHSADTATDYEPLDSLFARVLEVPERWWESIEVGDRVTTDLTRPDLVGGLLTETWSVVARDEAQISLLSELFLQGQLIRHDGGWDGKFELDGQRYDQFAGEGSQLRGRVLRNETLEVGVHSLACVVVELEETPPGRPDQTCLLWLAKRLPPPFCSVKKSIGGVTLRLTTGYSGPVFGE